MCVVYIGETDSCEYTWEWFRDYLSDSYQFKYYNNTVSPKREDPVWSLTGLHTGSPCQNEHTVAKCEHTVTLKMFQILKFISMVIYLKRFFHMVL